MALCEVKFFSDSLQKQDTMNVIVPEGRGPFPVLYLLHGLSDDYSIWLRRTSIERHVAGTRLIVVMPDTHRFFYVNDARPGGPAYEDHLIKDVVGFVDRVFPSIRHRRGRAVAGLSMGGFGAMMLAMKNPGMFCAAVSHSGALLFGTRCNTDVPGPEDAGYLQAALPRRKYDCFALARKIKAGRRKLAVRFDCGQDDFLIEHSRRFHVHLEKIGLEHEYAEHPGEHTWDYWDQHVGQTIAFVTRHLSSK